MTTQRARQLTFLAHLATGLTVSGAAAAARLDRSSAYKLRARDAGFAAEWDAALEAGADFLDDEARRRAVDGIREPVLVRGRLATGPDGEPLTITRYSDGLLMFLLKGRRKDKYGEKAAGNNKDDGKKALKVAIEADRTVLKPDEPPPDDPVL